MVDRKRFGFLKLAQHKVIMTKNFIFRLKCVKKVGKLWVYNYAKRWVNLTKHELDSYYRSCTPFQYMSFI